MFLTLFYPLLFPVSDLIGHILFNDSQTILDFLQVVPVFVFSWPRETFDIVPTVEGCPTIDGYPALRGMQETDAASTECGGLS